MKISTSNFGLVHKVHYHSRFPRRHTYTKYKMESILGDIRNAPWRFAFRAPFYFLSAKLAMDSVMSIADAIFTFLFGVALPSWDVYSDLFFSISLIIPRCYDYEDFKPYQYYEKQLNWTRKYTSFFRGIYVKAEIF